MQDFYLLKHILEDQDIAILYFFNKKKSSLKKIKVWFSKILVDDLLSMDPDPQHWPKTFLVKKSVRKESAKLVVAFSRATEIVKFSWGK